MPNKSESRRVEKYPAFEDKQSPTTRGNTKIKYPASYSPSVVHPYPAVIDPHETLKKMANSQENKEIYFQNRLPSTYRPKI